MMIAPIVLFVYNRPLHTKRTLEALQKNQLADKSKLFIFCDGPKENATIEQINKIKEVRAVCSSQQWCAEVKIVEADKNKGLANSVIEGVTQIINQYGKVIVLEDDIECNEIFLTYMNEGLVYYQNNEKVAGVTGFSFDEDAKLDDYFFLPIGSSWSWGTWKRVWDNFEISSEKILKKIENKGLEKDFNFGGYNYIQMLKDQISGKIDSWAIRFYGTIYLHEQYFLFPKKTLVENIGFDNSGTHCSDSDPFGNRLSNSQINFYFPEATLHKKNIRIIEKAFKLKLVTSKVETRLNALIMRIKDSFNYRFLNLIKR